MIEAPKLELWIVRQPTSTTRTGAWRLDLEGNPAGIVTADEEAHARATLAGIKAKKAARAAAAKAAAQPAIPQPPGRLYRSLT